MAVGQGANSQGLGLDKEEQVCSRLRLEETNSGCSRFISKGSEVQDSGLVKVNKRKATLNGEL